MDARELGELAAYLSALGEGNVTVSELYGPGRFTERASAFDMQPGTAYDLRSDSTLIKSRTDNELA